MILGFKQKFPWGESTYFREKILAIVGRVSINGDNISDGPIINDGFKPKIHTMRAGNRWKPGDKIHMAYGVRTKEYQQFNKGIPELENCISTQRIKLTWIYKNAYVETNLPLRKIKGPHGEFNYYPAIWVDDKPLNQSQIELLADNDGFDSIYQFFIWFNKDFTGQIIHFTNFRY